MSNKLQNQHPMVPVPEAIHRVLHHTAQVLLSNPHDKSEETVISTSDAALLGRTASRNTVVPWKEGHPLFPASIMDGYALFVDDNQEGKDAFEKQTATAGEESSSKWTHVIVGSSFAGEEHQKYDDNTSKTPKLPPATYVTTGAVVPPQYNAVIPIEKCTVNNDNVLLAVEPSAMKSLKVGQWIRPVGCDIPPETVLIKRGDVIVPSHVALLAQCGISELHVYNKIKVGVLSTGNEVQPLPTSSNNEGSNSTSTTSKGLIYDANRPALLALIDTMGAEGVDLGIATDDLEDLQTKIRRGLQECHVVITSGGVSMGDKDLLEEVLVERFHAKVHFGRMHMKPGKPTTFLTVSVPAPSSSSSSSSMSDATRDRLVFAMPGNPVSAMVCTHLLVRPALNLLQQGEISSSGENSSSGSLSPSPSPDLGKLEKMVDHATVHTEIDAVLAKDAKLDAERPEYHRVRLDWHHVNGGSGYFVATSTGTQRSSRLLSMDGADGLMCLPKGIPGQCMMYHKGQGVTVLLIEGGKWSTLMGERGGVKWKNSIHRRGISLAPSVKKDDQQETGCKIKKKKKEIPVGIIAVNTSQNRERIQQSVLSPLGQARVVHFESMVLDICSTKQEEESLTERFLSKIQHGTMLHADMVVFVAGGGFRKELEASTFVHRILEKNADAMAMQARTGASGTNGEANGSGNGILALFEVVAGWSCGKLILCLPELGVEACLNGLGTRLLVHAMSIGSGKGKH